MSSGPVPDHTKRRAGWLPEQEDLEAWLAEITGFAGVSLEPNAGSQGEYAGLLVIREYIAANPARWNGDIENPRRVRGDSAVSAERG